MDNIQAYQICKRCIMDTSDPEIIFDEDGYCNHCTNAFKSKNTAWHPNEEGEKRLLSIVKKIKESEKNKEYDCVLGLSGGVDSSFLAYKAIEYKLRPLVVHIDCGWNSELAVKNIENIVKKLNLDLHTHVVDWEEMKDLQLSFFKANVANQDVPQDHAIFAGLYSFAVKKNIKYVLNGGNFATESILPTAWGYNALDYKHIKSIHKLFGNVKLKKYPSVTFFKRYIYYTYLRRMTIVNLLNYIPYDKNEAIKILKEKLDWSYYGEKHHESRFTRFFQAGYLPKKFGYDKRRAHLSSLIVSGSLSRDEALLEIQKANYPSNLEKEDMEYVAKKLDITTDEFESIINQPNRTYKDFKNNEKLFNFGFKVRNRFFK